MIASLPVLALVFALTPGEMQIAEKAFEWKRKALVLREERDVLELKLQLTEESRRRWIKKSGERKTVPVPYVPWWVPPIMGVSVGVAGGALSGATVNSGTAMQGALYGGIAGALAGVIVSALL